MIGDSWRDIEAGSTAGCSTILLNGSGTEGYTAVSTVSSSAVEKIETENRGSCNANHACDNLLEAVQLILKTLNR